MAANDPATSTASGGEISFEETLSTFWRDEAFHDVTLRSTDGILISANRCALAARNGFFRKMFLTQFKEAKAPTVEVGFPGVIMNAVLEYLYTNKAGILLDCAADETSEPSETPSGVLSDDTLRNFQLLLTATEAAAYYDLPGLCGQISECLSIHLRVCPALSIVTLVATSAPEKIKQIAFTNIQDYPEKCLVGSVISGLRQSDMKILLEDSKEDLGLHDFHVFQLIQLWDSTTGEKDGHARAKELVAKHVDLKKVSPNRLSSSVAASGLVNKEQLFDAFKHQALLAEKEHGVRFEPEPEPNLRCIWISSQSKEFISKQAGWNTGHLDCKPMVSGKHQWKLKVNKSTSQDHLALGVVYTAQSIETLNSGNMYVGYKSGGGWSYAGNGYSLNEGIVHRCCQDLFRQDSVVTLTLDLTPGNPKNGSLSISVDHGPTYEDVSNLRARLVSGGGFIPAASIGQHGDSVEILSMKKL
ncbi:expressed unknown protein [Seminavis robusta]|uniref:BTB domain-containing protein n=1 Tax=Seminavis robusta TaxID=568900 RepID=A0A9N8HCM5_9STRA|nr:expressed unknown protein [Seminavis robusta]|eukprot:Sro225_g091780.1 n/a (472) ;mRNA; r:34389-35804